MARRGRAVYMKKRTRGIRKRRSRRYARRCRKPSPRAKSRGRVVWHASKFTREFSTAAQIGFVHHQQIHLGQRGTAQRTWHRCITRDADSNSQRSPRRDAGVSGSGGAAFAISSSSSASSPSISPGSKPVRLKSKSDAWISCSSSASNSSSQSARSRNDSHQPNAFT